jgi:predicted flap endonuclease-1-like 5' DNA nuclease
MTAPDWWARHPLINGAPVLILALIVIIALAAFTGYVVGTRRREPAAPTTPMIAVASPVDTLAPEPHGDVERPRVDNEKARIIRALSGESFALRAKAAEYNVAASELAQSRAETARYRQLVVDIETNAPPPILLGTAEPDDLKLIVGIGPVLERMLRNLGIGTFRQIARWTARDIAEFDAKLPEFPGRIVRDQWVTQARALHESKYGASPLGR